MKRYKEEPAIPIDDISLEDVERDIRDLNNYVSMIKSTHNIKYDDADMSQSLTRPRHSMSVPAHRGFQGQGEVNDPSVDFAKANERIPASAHRVFQGGGEVNDPSVDFAKADERIPVPAHRDFQGGGGINDPSVDFAKANDRIPISAHKGFQGGGGVNDLSVDFAKANDRIPISAHGDFQGRGGVNDPSVDFAKANDGIPISAHRDFQGGGGVNDPSVDFAKANDRIKDIRDELMHDYFTDMGNMKSDRDVAGHVDKSDEDSQRRKHGKRPGNYAALAHPGMMADGRDDSATGSTRVHGKGSPSHGKAAGRSKTDPVATNKSHVSPQPQRYAAKENKDPKSDYQHRLQLGRHELKKENTAPVYDKSSSSNENAWLQDDNPGASLGGYPDGFINAMKGEGFDNERADEEILRNADNGRHKGNVSNKPIKVMDAGKNRSTVSLKETFKKSDKTNHTTSLNFGAKNGTYDKSKMTKPKKLKVVSPVGKRRNLSHIERPDKERTTRHKLATVRRNRVSIEKRRGNMARKYGRKKTTHHRPRPQQHQQQPRPPPAAKQVETTTTSTTVLTTLAGETSRLTTQGQVNRTMYEILDTGVEKIDIPASSSSWGTLVHGHWDIVLAGTVMGGIGLLIIILAIGYMFYSRRSSEKKSDKNQNKGGGSAEEKVLLTDSRPTFLSSDEETDDSDEDKKLKSGGIK